MKSSLIILALAYALGAAQMTFSDGWEKRQPTQRYAHHYAHQKVARSGGHTFHEADAKEAGAEEKQDQSEKYPITEASKCVEGYMAGVREFNRAMNELYSRFQHCAKTDQANPLLPGNREKSSREETPKEESRPKEAIIDMSS